MGPHPDDRERFNPFRVLGQEIACSVKVGKKGDGNEDGNRRRLRSLEEREQLLLAEKVEIRPQSWEGEEYCTPTVRHVCRLDESFSWEVGSYKREQLWMEAIYAGFAGVDPSA